MGEWERQALSGAASRIGLGREELPSPVAVGGYQGDCLDHRVAHDRVGAVEPLVVLGQEVGWVRGPHRGRWLAVRVRVAQRRAHACRMVGCRERGALDVALPVCGSLCPEHLEAHEHRVDVDPLAPGRPDSPEHLSRGYLSCHSEVD